MLDEIGMRKPLYYLILAFCSTYYILTGEFNIDQGIH